ncbi:MAG: hypothetical protein ACI9Y1_003625 [Lentisphaeria bacterium]|jgi:hypothetical protein
MPLSFNLNPPTGTEQFSRSSDIIQIQWDQQELEVSVEAQITTTCTNNVSENHSTTLNAIAV